MNLYEINAEIADAIESMFDTVNEETGEIDAGTFERLETLKAERDAKFDGCGMFIKNETAKLCAINDEIAKLKARAKTIENRIDRVEKYVVDALIGTGEEKPRFESARCVLSLRSSESVNITDESALPPEFLKVKMESAPDKTAIKKAIKSGIAVSGAELITKNNLQIK